MRLFPMSDFLQTYILEWKILITKFQITVKTYIFCPIFFKMARIVSWRLRLFSSILRCLYFVLYRLKRFAEFRCWQNVIVVNFSKTVVFKFYLHHKNFHHNKFHCFLTKWMPQLAKRYFTVVLLSVVFAATKIIGNYLINQLINWLIIFKSQLKIHGQKLIIWSFLI